MLVYGYEKNLYPIIISNIIISICSIILICLKKYYFIIEQNELTLNINNNIEPNTVYNNCEIVNI
jgi:hypothetical protein